MLKPFVRRFSHARVGSSEWQETMAAVVEGSGETNRAYAVVDIDADGSLELKGYRKQETRSFPG